MKQIDKRAIEELGIPAEILMENAGRAVADKILELAWQQDKSVLIICGQGNNGGDGLIAARHLIRNSILTNVVSLDRFENIDTENFQQLVINSDIVVDAIFGTGLNSEIKGVYKEVIEIINAYSEGEVVSVDIPSGVNATTGEIMGTAVVADQTITFHSPKYGHFLYPGAELCGELSVVPIGIPDFLTKGNEFNTYLITEHHARITMPVRPMNGHKGTFGKVFNIAGSFNMPGAAYLCSKASLLVGAGYSILATTKEVIPVVASQAPEIVFQPLEMNSAQEKSAQSQVVLIGPGLGTEDFTVRFVWDFIQQLTNRGDNLIIDGDGLNALSQIDNIVLPKNSIITPHPKELSRLLKMPVDKILNNMLESARQAAFELNVVVVLKCANTIIAEPNGTVYINTTGNSGLATAGSGDVLSGVIAGFTAQGLEPKQAAILGVYVHGLAADIATKQLNEYSLTAGELLNYIPLAINRVLCHSI